MTAIFVFRLWVSIVCVIVGVSWRTGVMIVFRFSLSLLMAWMQPAAVVPVPASMQK